MADIRKLITNESDRILLMFVEPDRWDCWLRPGEASVQSATVASREQGRA